MKWTANRVILVCVVMLIAGIVAIVVATPKSAWNPVCYKGHRYTVDTNNVMWPIQTKHGVQKCLQGDVDVSK